jgi:DnaK suppressor protein
MTDHAMRDAELREMLTRRRTEMQEDMRSRIRDERAGRSRDGHDTLEYTEAQIQGDIEFALLQMRSEALTRIEQAIVRLDTGKYGLCSECANDISAERLRALPFAVRCQACEGAREQRRASSRDQPRSGLSIFAVGVVLLLAATTTMFA